MLVSFLRRHEDHLILIIGIALALALRFSLFGYESTDYKQFLSKWHDFIAHHGFEAFAHDFANYNPPYLYLMAIVIYLFPFLPKIVAIKSISVLFDLLLGWFVYKLVHLKYPASILLPVFGYLALLFAPTVFLNSSCWGQADSIYTMFLVACLYWICTSKQWLALAAFGFALTVKAQAMFFAPFLFVLLLKRQLSWKPFLLVPCVYLLTLVPAWISGRNFYDLLFIYIRQSNTYHELSKHAPNFYIWFPDSVYDFLYPAGLLLGLAVTFLVIAGIIKSSRAVDTDLIVQMSLVFVLVIPYFLPKMHERYFYPADVLAIVYAFYFPKYFHVPIVVIFCSFLSYLPYLFNVDVPLNLVSIFLGSVVVVVAHDFVRTLRGVNSEERIS
jgi:Gpi18-like mannosyltransferase